MWELFQVLKRENPATLDLGARIERRHPGLLHEFKRICDPWPPYWTERIGGPQTDHVTQRVIDFFLASADDIAQQIAALQPLGIKGISTVMYSVKDGLDMPERIAKELMPRFR